MSWRYGNPRTIQTRQVIPSIQIVCDDTRTAVEYFKLLKREVHGRKIVNIVPAPKDGASADEVLELARAPSTEDAQDKSFVLIDTDTNPDVERLRAKAMGKEIFPKVVDGRDRSSGEFGSILEYHPSDHGWQQRAAVEFSPMILG
jgi:hypothetical protein